MLLMVVSFVQWWDLRFFYPFLFIPFFIPSSNYFMLITCYFQNKNGYYHLET